MPENRNPDISPPAPLPPFFSAAAADVARVAELLRAGAVVAVPTETVYGLAAHALDVAAVRQIFAIKGRPLLDPLIVHGLDEAFLAPLAEFNAPARRLAAAFWPGPLTLVLPRKPVVPDMVTAGRATVAVRAPAHPLTRAILAASGLPLAAPSANPFGYLSPTRAEHVRASLGERAPWIVDGGPCAIGLESTIVDVSDPAQTPRILRPGPIAAADLERALGAPVDSRPPPTIADDGEAAPAPGMLVRHYSPRTPLTLLAMGETPAPPPPGARAAWVRLARPPAEFTAPPGLELFWLSEHGGLADAARGLYNLLRNLDNSGYVKIWCDPAPPEGLGAALNDRLRRAAAK